MIESKTSLCPRVLLTRVARTIRLASLLLGNKTVSIPGVDRTKEDGERLCSEDIHQQREDSHHLEEQEDAGRKRHHIRAAEVVQQVLVKTHTQIKEY